jgi:hypothetical protein
LPVTSDPASVHSNIVCKYRRDTGISAEVDGLCTLPLTVVPPLIRHHLLPRTDGFKQLR